MIRLLKSLAIRRATMKYILLLLQMAFASCTERNNVKILTKLPQITAMKSDLTLDVWLYKGENVALHKIFRSVKVNVQMINETEFHNDVFIYSNINKTSLIETFDNRQKILGFVHKWTVWPSNKLNPFLSTYVGVETLAPYNIRLQIFPIDNVLLIVFLFGTLLFFYGKKLSRNFLAFYIGGSTFGVIASILLLLFICYRFLPHKKTMAIMSLLTGAAWLNFYILYSMVHNLTTILQLYYKYLAVYLVIVGALSFALCYKYGPPTDVKSKNLIQWFIQILGLIFVYCACQDTNISIFLISLYITSYVAKDRLKNCYRYLRFRFFPPTRQLLTEDEYYSQGITETKKALDNLRNFCGSPNCDAWKYTSSLKSPRRFAAFVNGASHLSDQELLQYDTYSPYGDSKNSLDTDDENDDSDNDNNDVNESLNLDKHVVSNVSQRLKSQTFFGVTKEPSESLSRSYAFSNGNTSRNVSGKSLNASYVSSNSRYLQVFGRKALKPNLNGTMI